MWPQTPKFVWGKILLHFEGYCCHSTVFCHLWSKTVLHFEGYCCHRTVFCHLWSKTVLHFEGYCCLGTVFCHIFRLFLDMPWLLAWPFIMCSVCEWVITGKIYVRLWMLLCKEVTMINCWVVLQMAVVMEQSIVSFATLFCNSLQTGNFSNLWHTYWVQLWFLGITVGL
jgi:hypothetical protein